MNTNQPPQQADTPKVRTFEFNKDLFQPQDNGTGITRLRETTNYHNDYPNYTEYYNQTNQHPQQLQKESLQQLHQEHTTQLISRFNNNEISYEDLLLNSYGYDYLAAQGHDVRSPSYWFKKFKNFDFFDPTENMHTMSHVLAEAELRLKESHIDQLLNTPNSLFNEYVGNQMATEQTMRDLFHDTWMEVKEEFEGNAEEALRSYRTTSSPRERFSDDGQWYIHTDGRIYRITDDPNDTRRDAARIAYNSEGEISTITINNNVFTGSVLVDNIVSGASGFFITLAQTVSSVLAGAVDLATAVHPENELTFDRMLNMGLQFEALRNSNRFTAKARIDMDGFQFDDPEDWADMVGDFIGLYIGMKLSGGLGAKGLKMSQHQSITSAGKVVSQIKPGIANKMLYGSSKIMANVSNIHSGAAARGIGGWSGRTVFGLTHGTKDALSVYRNRRLAGDTEQEARSAAVTTLGINSVITFAIGSGAKDDTYNLYRTLAKGKRSFMVATPELAAKRFFTQARKAGMVTGGLDVLDNYFTMTIANQVEQDGHLDLDKVFSAEAFDFRTAFFSTMMATNAYRGAQRYQLEVGRNAVDTSVNEVFNRINQQKIEAKGRGQLDKVKTLAATEVQLRDIVGKEMQKESSIADTLEKMHLVLQREDQSSIVSDVFKDLNNHNYLRHAKEIWLATEKWYDRNKYESAQVIKGMMKDGVWGYVSRVRRGAGIMDADFKNRLGEAQQVLRANMLTEDRVQSLYNDLPTESLDITDWIEFDKEKMYDAQTNEYRFTIKNTGGKEQSSQDYQALDATLKLMSAGEGLPYFREVDGVYHMSAKEMDSQRVAETLNNTITALRNLHKGSPADQARTLRQLSRVLFGDRNLTQEQLDEMGISRDQTLRGKRAGDGTIALVRQAVALRYISEAQALNILKEYRYSDFTETGRSTEWYKALDFLKQYEKDNTATSHVWDNLDATTKGILVNAIDGLSEGVVKSGERSPFLGTKTLFEHLIESEPEEAETLTKINARVKKVDVTDNDTMETALKKNNHLFHFKNPQERNSPEMEYLIKKGLVDKQLKATKPIKEIFLTMARDPEAKHLFKQEYMTKFMTEEFFDRAKSLKNKTTNTRIDKGMVRINLNEIDVEIINRFNQRLDAYQNIKDTKLQGFFNFMAAEKGISASRLGTQLDKQLMNHQTLLAQYPEGFIDLEIGSERFSDVMRALGYSSDLEYVSRVPGITNGDKFVEIVPIKGGTTTYKYELVPTENIGKQYRGIDQLAREVRFLDDTVIDPIAYVPFGRYTGEINYRSAYTWNEFIRMKLATMGSKGQMESNRTQYQRMPDVAEDQTLLNTMVVLEILALADRDISEQERIGATITNRVRGYNPDRYWETVVPLNDKYEKVGRRYATRYSVANLKVDEVIKDLENNDFQFRNLINMDPIYGDHPYRTIDPINTDRARGIINVVAPQNVGRPLWAALEDLVRYPELARYLRNEGQHIFSADTNFYNDLHKPVNIGRANTVGEIREELRSRPMNKAEELFLEYLELMRTDELSLDDRIYSDVDLLNQLERIRVRGGNYKEQLTTYLNERRRIPQSELERNYSSDRQNRAMHRYTEAEIEDIASRIDEMVPELEREVKFYTPIPEKGATEAMVKASSLIRDGKIELSKLAHADKETLDALVNKVLKTNADKELVRGVIKDLEELLYYAGEEPKYIYTAGKRTLIPGINFPSILERSGEVTGERKAIQDAEILKYAQENAHAKADKERRVNLLGSKVIDEAMMSTTIDKDGVIVNATHKLKYEIEKQQFLDKHKGEVPEAQLEKLWSELKGADKIGYVFLDEDGEIIPELTVYGKTDNDLNRVVMQTSRNDLFENNAKKIVAVNTNKTSVFENTVTVMRDLTDNLRNHINGRVAENFENYKHMITRSYEKRGKSVPSDKEIAQSFLVNKQSQFRKTEMIFNNIAKGDSKLVQSLKQAYRVLEDTGPRYKVGEESNIDFVVNRNLDVEPEGFYGFDAFEQIINGVNLSRLTPEQSQTLRQSIDTIDTLLRNEETFNDFVVDEIDKYVGRRIAEFEKEKRGLTDPPKVKKEPWKDLGMMEEVWRAAVFVKTIAKSHSANAARLLLDDTYNVEDAFNEREIRFAPNRVITDLKDELLDRPNDNAIRESQNKIVLLDFEWVESQSLKHPISAGLRWGVFDRNNEFAEHSASRNQAETRNNESIIFKINETDDIRNEVNKIIGSMVARREDPAGYRREYEMAVKQTEDTFQSFKKTIQDLNTQGYRFVAHNIARAEAEVLREVFGIKVDNMIDSIELVGSSKFAREELKNHSLSMRALREYYGISKEGSHGAQRDTDDLLTILKHTIDENVERVADGGKVIHETNRILREAGSRELDADDMKNAFFDGFKHNMNRPHRFDELFGLGRNMDDIVKLQKTKQTIDLEVNKYHMTQPIREELERDLTIDRQTQSLIERHGVDHLVKLVDYLIGTSEPAKKYDAAMGIVNKIHDALYKRGDGFKDIEHKMFNPYEFTDDVIKAIVGDENFNKFKNHTPSYKTFQEIFDDNNIPEFRQQKINEALGLTRISNKIAEDIFDWVKDIGVDDKVLDYLRYKEEHRLGSENGEIDVVDELPLAAANYNKRIKNAYEIVLNDLFDDLMIKRRLVDSKYTNAVRMDHGKLYEVYENGKTITRRGFANEAIISEQAARQMFGDDWQRAMDELYGFSIGYPSDNPASKFPLKFTVTTEKLGEGFIIDENLAYTIQRDFDGDKLSFFAGTKENGFNPNKIKLLKALNDFYTKPFRDFREKIETKIQQDDIPPIERKTHAFEIYKEITNEIKPSRIKQMKDMDAKSLIKDYIERNQNKFNYQFAKDATERGELIDKDVDKIYERMMYRGISGVEEVYYYHKALVIDQTAGMLNKRLDGVVESMREFHQSIDRDNILNRTTFRDLIITDDSMDMFKLLFPEEDVAKFVQETRDVFANLRNDKTQNNVIFDLLMQDDISETNRVRESLELIQKVRDLSPQLARDVFLSSEGDISVPEIERYVRERTGIDPNLNMTFRVVENLDSEMPVRIGFVEGLGEDTIAYSNEFANRLGHRTRVEMVKPQNMQYSDYVTTRKMTKVSTVAQLEQTTLWHVANGIHRFMSRNPDFTVRSINFAEVKEGLSKAIHKLVEALEASTGTETRMLAKEASDLIPKDVDKFPFGKEIREEMLSLAFAYKGDHTVRLDQNIRGFNPNKVQAFFKPFLGSNLSAGRGHAYLIDIAKGLERNKERSDIVFQGMPLFESSDGEVVRANRSGKFTLDRKNNSITIDTELPFSTIGQKGSIEGTGAGKGMQALGRFDNTDSNPENHYDILVEVGPFMKPAKATLGQLDNITLKDAGPSVTFNGRTFVNPLRGEGTLKFIENLNLQKQDHPPALNRYKGTRGKSVDLMTWLANLRTALGYAEYDSKTIEDMIEAVSADKKNFIQEVDRSKDFITLRMMAIHRLLSPQERSEIDIDFDFDTMAMSDQRLKAYENAVLKVTGVKDLEELTKRIDSQIPDTQDGVHTKRTLRNLISYPTEQLYHDVVDEIFTPADIGPKKRIQDSAGQIHRSGVETSSMETKTTGVRQPMSRYMPSTKYYDILDMRYGKDIPYNYLPHKDFDAVKLGYKGIGKINKGSVKSGFRTSDANTDLYVDDAFSTNQSAKYGISTDFDQSLIRLLSEYMPLKSSSKLNTPDDLPGIDKLTVNPIDFATKGLIRRALNASIQMARDGEKKNAYYANANMRTIPKSMTYNEPYKFASLNVGEYKGKITTPAMESIHDVTADIRKGATVGVEQGMDLMKITAEDSALRTPYKEQEPVRVPEIGNIKKVQMIELEPGGFERQLLQDQMRYEIIDSGFNDDTPLKGLYSSFRSRETITRDSLVGKPFRRSLAASGGIGSVKKDGSVDTDAYLVDQIINDYSKKINIAHGNIRLKLMDLKMSILGSGRQAVEDFKAYQIYNAVLAYRDAMGEELSDATTNHLRKLTGFEDMRDIEKYMKDYILDYKGTNNQVVNALNEAMGEILEVAREAAIINNEPSMDMFTLMFPAFRGKDYERKWNMMFDRTKYDMIEDTAMMMGVDPLESFDKLSLEISKIKAMHETGEELKAMGLLANDSMVTDAVEFVRDAYNRLDPETRRRVDNSWRQIGDELKMGLGSKASLFSKAYDKAIAEKKSIFEASREGVEFILKYHMDEAIDVLNKTNPDLVKELDSIEGVSKVRTLIEDAHADAVLRELEFAYLAEAEFYEKILPYIDRDGFEGYVEKKRGLNFNFTDGVGRIITNKGVPPMPSELSNEYIKTSLSLNKRNLLANSLRGLVYRGNKDVTKHLNDNFYFRKQRTDMNKVLRLGGQTATKVIMGNPIRLLTRLERFTYTDLMMGMMANYKTGFFVGRARRELAQAISSNGRAATEEVKAYQRLRGSITGTDRDKDWYMREEQTALRGLGAKSAVGKVWEASLDTLNMQHDLMRYAIFLATLDDIQKHGEIKRWGAAYGFRHAINQMGTPEERAARVAFHNIATFGNMPYALRYMTPWLVFTSYLSGQIRWAGEWGLTMRQAMNDAVRGEDPRSAISHLATPVLGAGLMYLLGNLIYNAIGNMYDVDEEEVERWEKERNYIELSSTILTGAPVKNMASGSPIEQLYKEIVETITTGFEGNGIIGVPQAFFNKQLLARVNPVIKIPFESMTGKMYFTEFPIEDKYHDTFLDNMLRKVSGTFIGIQAVNAVWDERLLNEYRPEDRSMIDDFKRGMLNAVSSEFGNNKKYKRDLADFYKARSLVYTALNDEKIKDHDFDFFNETPTTYNYSSGNFDQADANRIANAFRTVMNRNENPTMIYDIIQTEMEQGTGIGSIHAALNRISVQRLINRLNDTEGFMATLSEKERFIMQNAIAFENQMFPAIHHINLYDLTGQRSGWARDYIPYNRSTFLPYESDYRPWQPQYDPRIYPSMGGHYDPREQSGFYQRWKPKPEWQRRN